MALALKDPSIYGSDEGQYFDFTRLKRQYLDYLGTKMPEIEEQKDARRYYHGAQWTADELKALKARRQPVVTSNRIRRKIDAIVGLVERLRQDPKAYPRTPQQEQGADLATAVLRYALDQSDWKSKSPRCARFAAIDGLAGVEYDLIQGDEGDPDLALHIVYPDTFFYDPRSYDDGFTDARYMGVAKWVDVEQAIELVPDQAGTVRGLVETGTDLSQNSDREVKWINVNEKKLRLVDHWYIHNGHWCWALYISNTILMEGKSPFIDERGNTFPKFRMFSCYVDQDGDRCGFIRDLRSLQDEVNHRRSRALHALNMRRLIIQKGAVDNVETTRKEWARPDGVIEENIAGGVKADDWTADFKGQSELLQEAKNEIENFGPNPALIGQGLEDSSGRAIALLQQAGIAELGPYLLAYKSWKIRVYRDIWNIIQRTWKAERWVRVTDDQQVAQFVGINQVQMDQFGRPQMVNAIGALDVDIIIDEGADTVNMQADNFSTLQSLGPQFIQTFPELAIELSPIGGAIKKSMLDKIKQQQSQPKQDPKAAAMQMQAQLDQQARAAELQAEQQRAAMKLQADQQSAELKLQADREAKQADMMMRERERQDELAFMREKAAADLDIERDKIALQEGAKMRMAELDRQLERDRMAIDAATANNQIRADAESRRYAD